MIHSGLGGNPLDVVRGYFYPLSCVLDYRWTLVPV